MNSVFPEPQIPRCLSSSKGVSGSFEKRAWRDGSTLLMVRVRRRPTKKSGRSARKKLDNRSEWSINETESSDHGHRKMRRDDLKEGKER
jgi:hypothetical protein